MLVIFNNDLLFLCFEVEETDIMVLFIAGIAHVRHLLAIFHHTGNSVKNGRTLDQRSRFRIIVSNNKRLLIFTSVGIQCK